MTRPLGDDNLNVETKVGRVRYRTTRLERRPAPAAWTIKVYDDLTAAAVGDGKFIFAIPVEVDGMRLDLAHAFVTTAGGLVTVQIRNVTQAHDMLSTPITIDAGEYTSHTAATPPVVNDTYSLVNSGDRIAVDVDAAGGGALGLGVNIGF